MRLLTQTVVRILHGKTNTNMNSNKNSYFYVDNIAAMMTASPNNDIAA